MNKLPFFEGQPYQKYSPNVFDDSLSLYEQIIAFIEHFNKVIESNNDIVDFVTLTKKEQNDIIADIRKDLDDFLKNKESDFVKFVNMWLEQNMESIIKDAVKMVWFGLTDDGHFMAVIPNSWNEIDFDTTINGELILQY